MYKARRRFVILSTGFISLVAFLILGVALSSAIKPNMAYPMAFVFVLTATIFLVMHLFSSKFLLTAEVSIETGATRKGETALISDFIDRLRFCYSLDDLTQAIIDVIEKRAGCSVLYVDSNKDYILYNSPDRVTSSKDVIEKINQNFASHWKDGTCFISEEYGVVSSAKECRGFMLSYKGFHFFVFCRFARLFDSVIYGKLFEEFVRFQKRWDIITRLSEIAELSKEWQQLAQTQRAFLPENMPVTNRLRFSAVYKPLINVSGDYYSVLPIDEDKTLLMLGDVSGKGLAAALVMGLVMNTVKSIEDKEDLSSMMKTVDKTIKSMRLQDKYTVLFIGVVDTKKMNIRYINASMSDPIIATRSPDGYRIKPLESNCSIIGIIDLDDELTVAEQRLFRGDVIFLSSDGISETMNEKGEELGDTKLYSDTIKNLANKSPIEFTDGLLDLVESFRGQKKLHDDITMLVAKVV